MTHSKIASNGFYQELGKIFYAIAAADEVVKKEELETLRALVRSEWLDLDQTFDEFGTDLAYQIDVVFDWLDDKKAKANALDALKSLEAFKKDHPSMFTPLVNDLILKTARAIMSSFHGNNKSELVVMSRLEVLLTKV
jgi:hypothetical protein